MNYLEIVLQGYLNKNNRDFLNKYFYREFKKAQKENFYEADEFFNGCLDVVNFLKQDLQNKVWDRKNELLMMLEGAKNKTMPIKDLQGKSVEKKRKETIEYCKKELGSETAHSIGGISFTVNLIGITNGRYTGSLYISDIENIELGIRKAKLRAYEVKNDDLKTKPSNKSGAETDIKKRILDSTADWRFFQIEVVADIKIDGKTYKNIKQRNNDSILTPDNWEQHKDTFFKQRMETYPESYTQSEKINLELEDLEKLPINENDYKILKKRYKKYLNNLTAEAVQETPQPEKIENEYAKAIEKLKTIWLAEPKISIEDFIRKGVDKGLWNENLKIITSRGSLYSTGKTLLSSIYFAFKGWAISSNTDYKEVGKVFCEVFNIEIKEATSEKYKAFSSGNPKIITQIKRTFGIRNS